ncbi:MAG: hypothetical protein ACK4TR_09015 [Phenylobacterium sp.]|uniref:hypothetical protein n=1 Tax=Phenylobacterium sp. TaxID=1871053 RepID=UPI0039187D49
MQLYTLQDRIRHASTVAELREPAFRLAHRMQDIEPAAQYRALMLAAVVATQALGLDPHDEIERARRMVSHAEGPFTAHVQALRDYVRGELLGR